MLHRPWSIVLLALALSFVGPAILLTWLRQINWDPINQWQNINPLVASIGLLSPFVAAGIWLVRPWGYFSYLLLSCLSLGHMLYEYVMAADLENYGPLLVSALFAIGTCLLLQKHVTAPYFNPRLRWWERDPRYRVQLDAKFQIDRQSRKGSMLDISRSGCFAELDTKLIVGEEIELRIQLIKFDVTTRARVIWGCDDPKGYGLMFLGMTRRHQREIDRIIAHLIDAAGERGPLINQGIRPAA